jgi:hypothetical protein
MLMASENRVLRRIFGPKTEEVMGRWKQIHGEELHGLYSLPNNIRTINIKEDEIGGECSVHEDVTKCWLGSLKGRDH